MKPRSRGADGRFIRELPDGTIDAVALGTIATGLVLGAADHVPSADARPVEHHAAPNIVPPLPESAATPVDAPPAIAPSPANGPIEAASHADGLSTATALAQTLSPEGDSSGTAPAADTSHADTPPLHETLGAIADTISSAMQTLVDHVQANATQPNDLSSVMQHVGAIADSAVAMVNDIAATALPALPGLPALPAVTETVHQVLDATLPELPVIPAVPQVLDHVLGAASPPDLPAIHTDLPASVLGAADAVIDHVAAPIIEAQPLQIGFLGQSYTEVHDPQDPGSHGLTSMLHGMV